jgi:hypothetical protein
MSFENKKNQWNEKKEGFKKEGHSEQRNEKRSEKNESNQANQGKFGKSSHEEKHDGLDKEELE